MDHRTEGDLSHRQVREHKKEEYAHRTLGKHLSSLHPAWYVVVGVVLIGVSMLIWISMK